MLTVSVIWMVFQSLSLRRLGQIPHRLQVLCLLRLGRSPVLLSVRLSHSVESKYTPSEALEARQGIEPAHPSLLSNLSSNQPCWITEEKVQRYPSYSSGSESFGGGGGSRTRVRNAFTLHHTAIISLRRSY